MWALRVDQLRTTGVDKPGSRLWIDTDQIDQAQDYGSIQTG